MSDSLFTVSVIYPCSERAIKEDRAADCLALLFPLSESEARFFLCEE